MQGQAKDPAGSARRALGKQPWVGGWAAPHPTLPLQEAEGRLLQPGVRGAPGPQA